jgi:hypothetical protein
MPGAYARAVWSNRGDIAGKAHLHLSAATQISRATLDFIAKANWNDSFMRYILSEACGLKIHKSTNIHSGDHHARSTRHHWQWD